MRIKDYRRGLRRRLVTWLADEYHPAVMAGNWLGTPAQKSPIDAWIYQEILFEVKPEVVVELGNARGGGAMFLCHILDLMKADGAIVVCVDHSHQEFQAEHPRIVTVTGDTHAAETVARVTDLCSGRRTLVIHDADHRADPVLTDLRNYAPLVSPGSYLIVEDGIADALPGGLPEGPLAALGRFLAESPEFEADPTRERYGVSYNPGGYLRRRG